MCVSLDGLGMRRSCMDMRVWPMDIDIDIELLRSMKEDYVLWSTNWWTVKVGLHTILTQKKNKN